MTKLWFVFKYFHSFVRIFFPFIFGVKVRDSTHIKYFYWYYIFLLFLWQKWRKKHWNSGSKSNFIKIDTHAWARYACARQINFAYLLLLFFFLLSSFFQSLYLFHTSNRKETKSIGMFINTAALKYDDVLTSLFSYTKKLFRKRKEKNTRD